MRQAAEQQLETAERHDGERRQLLMFEREAEVLSVEVGGALHVSSLVPDTMQSTNRPPDVLSSFIGGRCGFAVCRFH